MNYTIQESELKDRGYIFQKLYAADYKTYRKEVAGYKIWLWVKGKSLEINDWYEHTESIINLYKEKIADYKEVNYKGEPSPYMELKLNRETGEVKLYNDLLRERGIEKFSQEHTAWRRTDSYYEWSEVIIHLPSFVKVVKEVEYLTK